MNYLTYLYKTKSSVLYDKRFSSSEKEIAKWHFSKMDRNSDGVSSGMSQNKTIPILHSK